MIHLECPMKHRVKSKPKYLKNKVIHRYLLASDSYGLPIKDLCCFQISVPIQINQIVYGPSDILETISPLKADFFYGQFISQF